MLPGKRSLLVALVLVACSTGGLEPAAMIEAGDLVPYRTLSRQDFKGVDPPPALAAYRDRLGAATCGLILPADKAQIRARRTSGGAVEVVVTNLSFVAKMDRSCSWWNDRQDSQTEEYVLEHEQIHFALFELEVRRLNAELRRTDGQLRATAATAQQAQSATQNKMRALLQDAQARALERSRQFDEDTSMSLNVEKQREWRDRVAQELARPADRAAP